MRYGHVAIVCLLALGAGALGSAAGCANGLVDADAGGDDSGASGNKDVVTLDAPVVADTGPADSGVPDVQPPDAGCPPSDAGLGGIGVPIGTTATATGSYQTNTPNLAVDGDPSTYWNAGGFTGSLTIAFPSAIGLNGVRLIATANPAATETYTVYGIVGGTPNVIGSGTRSVPAGFALLAPIALAQGTYDGLRIDVSSQGSWAAIAEVSVLTAQCP